MYIANSVPCPRVSVHRGEGKRKVPVDSSWQSFLITRAIDKPKPVPLPTGLVVNKWSKILALVSSGIPRPLSLTLISIALLLVSTEVWIWMQGVGLTFVPCFAAKNLFSCTAKGIYGGHNSKLFCVSSLPPQLKWMILWLQLHSICSIPNISETGLRSCCYCTS